MSANRTAERQSTICFQPRASPSIRLVCLPHAGAGASLFRGWGARLPDWVEVRGLSLPGRDGRRAEPLPRDLGRLVDELASSWDRMGGAPYALYGHSMGALLAFELARRLDEPSSRPPVHLFLAGYGAPHVFRTQTRMHLLSDDALIDELRRTGAAPEAVLRERQLMELLLPVLRADLAMCVAYEFGQGDNPSLSMPISAFAGSADNVVPAEAVAAWGEVTTGPFRLQTLPGGHFFPGSAEADLLATIARDLSVHLPAAS